MTSTARRLSALEDVVGTATPPSYDPTAHGCGIVHLGTGAFHRAHQAVYTDDALASAGGDWRIIGVSLRSGQIADALNSQNGFYTLIERGANGTRGRVIGAIDHVIAASRDRRAPLAALLRPQTRVVTLTVTEKAYGIDRAARRADTAHPAVAADLARPANPEGVLGLIVQGLRLRRERGIKPFTVLCCDNLPENGVLLGAGAIDFARRLDPELADWIEANVAFPSSVVDRITPAATEATLEEAERLTGCMDYAAIETEPFSQWIIEDRFCNGHPRWEKGGALFVSDVKPYELMKLRMLNGAHSMLAYAGFLSGHRYVRDVMADKRLSLLVDRHLRAARRTLPELPDMDLDQYRRDLVARFENPAIAHETYQIAMDGTEKLPQRIFSPALEILQEGGDPRPFAFAVAAWMRYCMGKHDNGAQYALRDPREAEIRSVTAGCSNATGISNALVGLPGLFDPIFSENQSWRSLVTGILHDMLEKGMPATIADEAKRSSAK